MRLFAKINLWLGLSLFAGSVFSDPLPARDFARFSQFEQMVLSPTGEYLAASLINEEGRTAVVVMKSDTLEFVSTTTFKNEEVPGRITWLNNERIGMPLLVQRGSLDRPISYGDYLAFDADGDKSEMLWGARQQEGLLVSPDLTRMQILDLLPEEKKYILVTEYSYAREYAKLTKVYRLNVYNGKKRRIATAPARHAYMLSDHEGEVRVTVAQDEKNDNAINLFTRKENGDDWALVKTFEAFAGEILPIAFAKDNRTLYAMSDVDAPTKGIIKINIDNPDEQEVVYRHDKVDINTTYITDDMELISASVSPDFNYQHVLDEGETGKWLKRFQASFPNDNVFITSATRDWKKMVLFVNSAQNPGDYYLFDAAAGKLRFLTPSRPWIDPKQMAIVEPIKIAARDGQELYGYLTLPKGDDKNLPLVVFPHGGPHGPRDFWRFDSDAQFLASRGYAVLQINFRGSGGYGREFLTAGFGEWGATMQDDVTDATLWAIKSGLADRERVCIYGGSYGGYAALMGVVKEPDLYQCAVGFVGVYSLPMMFEEGDIPRQQSGINFLKRAIGEDQAKLEARSPAYNVDKIKAALLLIHGGEDIRVPIEQMEFLMEKLDEKGHAYETLVKDKEGHGFYNLDNREEFYQRLEAFLDKHIGNKKS